MVLNKSFIYFLLGVIITLVIGYLFIPNDTSYIDEYKNKIENLEKEIKYLNSLNDSLIIDTQLLFNKIDSLGIKVDNKDIEILTLKKELNEKINNINNLTNNELYLFFTNRYREVHTSGT